MATETNQPEMEDILSSIRTTMAEETAKVGSGSADLIEAAAAQDGDEDDVLELSVADMVAAPGSEGQGAEEDELIDIAAFGSTGESKPVNGKDAAALAGDLLGEAATAPAAEANVTPEAAADEFDRLLAEISQEQQQQVAAAEVSKQALMDEELPLGTEAAAAAEVPQAEPVVEEPVVEEIAQAVETAAVEELATGAAQVAVASGSAPSFALSAVQGPDGVQVAFPAEVLAMALRPMVQDWLAKNLPAVVEKLVKEEISKLTQN